MAGTCPKITDKGSPEFAKTKEPTTKRGSIVVTKSASCATANVGAASIETIPVVGSMLMIVRMDARPDSMGSHCQ